VALCLQLLLPRRVCHDESVSCAGLQVSVAGSVVVEALMEVERYSHVMHISSTVTGKLLPGLDAWDVMRAALPAGTVSGAPKVGTEAAGNRAFPGIAAGNAPVSRRGQQALGLRTSLWSDAKHGGRAGSADFPPRDTRAVASKPSRCASLQVRAMQIIDELEVNRRGPYGGGIGHVSFTGGMDMALALRTMVVPYPPPTPSGSTDGDGVEWAIHLQVWRCGAWAVM
jgi:chorismate binding enzyme